MQFFFSHHEHKGSRTRQIALFVFLCAFHLFTFSPFHLISQISRGGQPASFDYKVVDEIPELVLPAPDIASLRNEDSKPEKMGLPERVGISIAANIDVLSKARHDLFPDGRQTWRLIITC